MGDDDVIELFRHYRHDLMNHLQVIDGYASMGKTDKLQHKLKDYLTDLQEESKLINLNAPAFSLYILQLMILHPRFHLAYRIGMENADLRTVDQLLAERSEEVMAKIERTTNNLDVYDLTMQLDHVSDDIIELAFTVSGYLPPNVSIQNLEDRDKLITVYQEKNSMKYIVTIPYE
ncbi:hypothetical protein GCM10028778_08430 [Barrientosiimonas marina]|uniref:Spo0B domain-containing protein n=1 Tax=Lentibacillus kimchii TaxID=1542911 RepID=A0ABW2UYC4_9BACI